MTVEINLKRIFLFVSLSMMSLQLLNLPLGLGSPWVIWGLQTVCVLILLSFMILHIRKTWMLLLLFSIFFVIVAGAPVFDWDARFIWFFHAKRIFLENNLYAQLDNYFWESHNDYPVLIPAQAASLAKAIGHWNEVFPRLVVISSLIPIFLLAFLLFRMSGLFILWLCFVLVVGNSFLVNGYQDAILGLYASLGLILLMRYRKEGDLISLSAFGLTLASLLHIKNEGLLLALILFSIFLVRCRKSNLWSLLIPLAAFIFYYFFWKEPLAAAHLKNDLFIPGVFDRLLNRLKSPQDLLMISKALGENSGFFILCLLVSILRPGFKWLLSWEGPFLILNYLGALLLIYLITPHELQWHLETSANRTFMSINLLIVSYLLFEIDLKTTVGTEAPAPIKKDQASCSKLICVK